MDKYQALRVGVWRKLGRHAPEGRYVKLIERLGNFSLRFGAYSGRVGRDAGPVFTGPVFRVVNVLGETYQYSRSGLFRKSTSVDDRTAERLEVELLANML